MSSKDELYMQEALNEANKAYKKDEIPVGAVVVYKDKIIARGYTKKESKNNPLNHAEIIALKKASKKLKTWKLNETRVYSTLEPCELCASAIVSYRVNALIYGADKISKNNLSEKILLESSLNHKVKEIKRGVLKESCKKILQDYFKKKRV